ncbi:CUB and sushi domain-containing protein 1, partial [Caerostris darwini]
MKLSVISLFFLAIFLRTSSLIQGVDFEDGPPENEYPNNEYEEIATLEPEDAESNVTLQNDEIFKGNESIHVELPETTTESNIRRSFGNGKAKSPELDPDECGDPPAVTHAKVTSERQAKYRENAKVTYNCEFGFIVAGPMQFSECLRSEETEELYWTDPGNLCAPRSCGDPGLVSNAHRLGFVFTFPNKVSYECDDGYKLRGFGSRYCQASGTWSGSLPTCEPVFCNPPSDPKNGKVSYSSLKFGSELRYECDPGFNLKEGKGRICSENGTWVGEEPICKEAQCEPPVAPEFGSVQVLGNGVASMALYKCEDNFVLVGSATSRCLDIGVWTFPTPKCLEPCSVPKVAHGKIGRYVGSYGRNKFQELPEGAKTENNEKLYLTCESKYEPFGTTMMEEEITCNLGEWSRIPRCEPAKCRGPPPPTDNADMRSVNRTHKGGVVYLCKGYFKKTKFGNVTCSFGTWKGDTPVCKDTKCYLEKLSFTGLETKGLKNVYYRNQVFTATCKSGYNATKENNRITCVEGEWKGHLPPCLA